MLSITYRLAAIYYILTSTSLYVSQDFPHLFVIIFLSYSTPPNHGYTNTSARWRQIRSMPIDGCFIQDITPWHSARMRTSDNPPWCCQWSHQKYDPGCTFKNLLYNQQQHATGCGYIHTMVNSRQLTVWCTAGVHRDLHVQDITAHNKSPPWSTNTFVCTVGKIEHQDIHCSGIFVDEFRDKHPWQWTKQALVILEEAPEAYMVEVIANSHC